MRLLPKESVYQGKRIKFLSKKRFRDFNIAQVLYFA